MIDLDHLEKYTENNRIEAKKALGGLPHSIWETYSAFANALGGVILLGVEEYKDKTLHTVDLPDPEALVREFLEAVNDPCKASVNLLTENQVRIEEVNGNRIIVIEVPRAQRYDRPVFVGGDPIGGSYRRNGEGDHRCTAEELEAMHRDADIKTQDMRLLEDTDISVLCAESIAAYRQCMKRSRPHHVWTDLDDTAFLLKLGAAGTGADGSVHPTAAGLLMFGYEKEILREYPQYCLDCREEQADPDTPAERFISSSGEWSGNVFDFYQHVYSRLKNGADELPVNKAIREALANCLVNADYYGRKGIVIVRKQGLITMSNPGDFRVGLEDARSGGLSDPRNGIIMKMFYLIDIGERAGSGIPSILYIWKQQGWSEPTLKQSFDPDRITLSLPLTKRRCEKAPVRRSGQNAAVRTAAQKAMIIDWLTERAEGTVSEAAELLGVRESRAAELLAELAEEGIAAEKGEGQNRTYKLKA